MNEIIKSETTLSNIKDSLDALIVRVLDGDEDALNVFSMLKRVEKITKDSQSRIDHLAREEADKEPAKIFEKDGFIIEKRNGGKQWNFKHLPEWILATSVVKEIEAKYKNAWLQNEKGVLEPTEDGEILSMPIVTYKKDSLIIKQ